MQDKLLGTLYEYFVHFFHVQLGPQGNSRKGLRFTPVNMAEPWPWAGNQLRSKWTDFSRLAAVRRTPSFRIMLRMARFPHRGNNGKP